jgi:hypothetical protein
MSTQSQLRPVGGLAYMVTAPTDMESALADPIHAIIYMSFMILSCGGLSYMWISVSGSSVKEEVQKMQAEGFHLASSRATRVGQTDSYAIAVLQKYIPTAALLGGMAIGACPPPHFVAGRALQPEPTLKQLDAALTQVDLTLTRGQVCSPLLLTSWAPSAAAQVCCSPSPPSTNTTRRSVPKPEMI